MTSTRTAPSRLICMFDGTWQTADQKYPTNIAKLAKLQGNGADQSCWYDPGVGTGWPRFAGGLFGSGLRKNILQAYEWLRKLYRPGDWIILEGFSRGAYTARELGGMLGAVGFDNPTMPVEQVWTRYRAMYRTTRPIPVQMIAVFDTVGARGVPVGNGRWALAPQIDDCNLGAHVAHGIHIVAIHERRKAFRPALWTNEAEHGGIEQVWSPGWHSDVGGGAQNPGLSDHALNWLIPRLQSRAGVTMRDGWERSLRPDAHIPHNEPGLLTRLYGMEDRIVPPGAVRI